MFKAGDIVELLPVPKDSFAWVHALVGQPHVVLKKESSHISGFIVRPLVSDQLPWMPPEDWFSVKAEYLRKIPNFSPELAALAKVI